MKLARFLESILEIPQNFKRIKQIFYAGLALVVLLDLFIPRHHIFFFWDKIPGFSAIYGLISCILIILVSKFVGHRGLMKREDYYD